MRREPAGRRQIRAHAGLRGIAALLVIFYHLQFGTDRLGFETATPFFRRCYLFVDLFFLLSGFIIAYANDADRPSGFGVQRTKRFLVGRVIRLVPLHLFCLTYLVAFSALVLVTFEVAGHGSPLSPAPNPWLALVAQALLVNAWIPGAGGWNVPSWSISAEFGAYLLFPLLVGLRAKAPRTLLALLLTLPLAFYAGIWVYRDNLDLTVGLGPLRCIAGFMLGVLIFFARRPLGQLSAWMCSGLQLVAIAGIVADLLLPLDDIWFVPASALLVATTWSDRGLLAWLLALRPAQWLGEISYSIYLNHYPLLMISGFAWVRLLPHLPLDPVGGRSLYLLSVFAGTLAISALTFALVEKPARTALSKRWLSLPVAPIETVPAAP